MRARFVWVLHIDHVGDIREEILFVKRISIAVSVASALWSCTVLAAPGFHDPGPSLTDGGASDAWTSLHAARNPAGGELAIAPDARVRTGILSSMGFGVEVGPVDDFAEEIQDLVDQLDRDDISLSEGTALVDRFNAILPAIGADGYVKLHSGVHVPLFPFLLRTEVGVFTLDANIAAQGRLGVLDAPLTFNPVSEELETASAAYVKSAMLTEFAVGFSRPVWTQDSSKVIVGGSVRYLRAALSKQVIALESVEDDEDIKDLVKDAYDSNEHTSNAVTIDVGTIYSGSSYRVGLTVANLTEPEFQYGALGANCAALADDAQYNCYSAAFFGDRIALTETWTLERLATVEGALSFAGGAGTLSGSVDLNEVRDPVGDLTQGAHVALGYKTQTPWLPDVRVGYRRNLAGTQLSSASLGFTFFGAAHLDVAYGLESTRIEDRSVPRTFGINLGFEMSF